MLSLIKLFRLEAISNKDIIKVLKHNLRIAFLLITALLTITATVYVFAVGEVFVASTLPFDSATGAVEFSRFADIDKDGDDDLFLVSSGKNRLFLNDGRGNFNESQNAGIAENGLSKMATFGDYDNDNNLDFFLPNLGGKNYLYHGDGDGTFTKIEFNISGFLNSASWININNDNLPDLFVTDIYGKNSLYKNSGNGTFTKLSQGEVVNEPGKSYGIVSSDINNDGKPDLLVLNDGGNFLYLNDGHGTLSKVLNDPIVNSTGNSTGGDFGDIDNDGDFDLFVANYRQASVLYSNNGNGTFNEILNWPAANITQSSRGGKFADINNDGDLDLLVLNTDGEKNSLYINNGNGTFVIEESAPFDTILSFGKDNKAHPTSAAFSDIDNDGDLDIFMSDSFGTNTIFKNSGNQNKWININLEGTKSNTSAIGAKIKIKSVIGGNPTTQTREITAADGNSFALHFGLGDSANINKITVEWPSGITQVLRNINTNQSLSIEEIDEGILSDNFINDGDMESALVWAKWGSPATNQKVTDPEGNTQVTHLVSAGGGIQQSGIPVIKNHTYRLSFDAKIASGSLLPRFNILKHAGYNKNGDFYDNNLALSSRDYAQWKRYTRIVTIPPDYDSATNAFRVALLTSNPAGQAEAWLDNVEFVEVTNSNLVYDGEMQLKQLWLLWGTPALNEKIYDRNLRSQVSRIRTNDLGSSGGIRQDNIRVLPSHKYEFSFDLKLNSGYLMPSLNILRNANYNRQADFSGNAIRLLARDYGNWTHYSRVVTIPLDFNADANSLRLSLVARNQNAFSEAWIDNVKMIEVFED